VRSEEWGVGSEEWVETKNDRAEIKMRAEK
jgi:hypothetical protein